MLQAELLSIIIKWSSVRLKFNFFFLSHWLSRKFKFTCAFFSHGYPIFERLFCIHMGEVVERCTIAHFRTFITSNPCRIVECSSFLYFSVPMYRKQLGLSENIYLCSLSLDFLAVIAFQSSKNHENSDFSVKFTYISFSSFLKSHFTAHCEFCALPHTSQFKYQILFRMSGCKITRTRQGWIGVGRKTERLWSRLVCLVAEILNDSIQSKCLLHLVAHTSYQS